MKKRSIVFKFRILIILIIPVLAVALYISYSSSTNLKQQISIQLRQAVQLYTDQINKQFTNINFSVLNLLIYDDSVRTLRENRDELEINYSKTKVKDAFAELQRIYGNQYSFFLYNSNTGDYIDKLGITEYLENPENADIFRAKLVEMLVQNKIKNGANSNMWTVININDKIYVIQLYKYEGIYMGSVMLGDDMLLPITKMNLGSDGFTFLWDSKGNVIDKPERVKENKIILKKDNKTYYMTGKNNQYLLINTSLLCGDFHVGIAVTNWGYYETLSQIQVSLFVLSILLICIIGFVLLYVTRNFVKPIYYFSNHLNEFIEKEKIENDSTSEELDIVGSLINRLIGQIKSLKIEVYEEQLEKQKVQLDYYNVQIRPHFFLNFMNLFYNMAQSGRNEEIQQLALDVSDYLRYVFSSGMKQVLISKELENVDKYIEIQKLRLFSEIECQIIQRENALEYTVSPLLIQTFAENAIKHALSMEKKLIIQILVEPYIENGTKYAKITISDNGNGFPQNVLESLNNEKPLLLKNGRERIGISNSIQRLKLMYGEKGKISFNNGEFGAIITMLIPVDKMEKIIAKEKRLQ